MTWQFRAGRWIWKKRRPIFKYGRRAISFERTRRRAIKYRRKSITKKYTKSKGKSRMTSFTGKTTKRRKPMRAPSAPKRSRRSLSRSRRRTKWCYKHKRYDMCHMYTK